MLGRLLVSNHDQFQMTGGLQSLVSVAARMDLWGGQEGGAWEAGGAEGGGRDDHIVGDSDTSGSTYRT